MLIKLPQQQKLQSLSYVQKLQENWNDPTEKTRTILDFENYIFGLQLSNENELIQILESLLVEWQEDQSQKQITYQALVNLIPEDISCEVEAGICYDNLVSKLEDIRMSDDTEYNKTLGSEILQVIGAASQDQMSNAQKLDFKAILTSLVYGWEVSEIPDVEKQEIVGEWVSESQGDTSSGFMSLLLTILKWLAIIILVIIWVIAVFYLLYLILNKDKSVGFSEYILSITGSKSGEVDVVSEDVKDILWEFQDTPEIKSDILSDTSKKIEDPDSSSTKINTTADPLQEEVPDWLKGNFTADEKKAPGLTPKVEVPGEKNIDISKKDTQKTQDQVSKPQQESKADISATDQAVPDWLKGGSEPKKETPAKTPEKKKETLSAKTSQDTKSEPVKSPDDFDLEKDTKISQDNNVPDWLKGSFDESKQGEKKEETPTQTDTSSAQETPKEETPAQSNVVQREAKQQTTQKEESPLNDDNVPDWLKGSFDTPKTGEKKDETGEQKKFLNTSETTSPEKLEEAVKIAEKKTESKPVAKMPTKEKTADNKEAPTKKPAAKKTTSSKKSVDKKLEIETATPAKKAPTPAVKKETLKDQTKDKKDELWDDGMKIPDWLKSDDEK